MQVSTRIWLLVLVLIAPVNLQAISNAGDRLVERGSIADDYYAAGGNIDLDAEVDGDVIVAGGELNIGRRVTGDVIAAGGRLKIRGEIDDDVRIAGGELDIDAAIGDDLAASGGSILLSTATTIGGDAWLAGGEVVMAGSVAGNLRIGGGKIRLSGKIGGDVVLEGGEIEILDGAEILGNLEYASPQPAATADSVHIGGRVQHETAAYTERGFGLFFSITLVVASLLFYQLFPYYTQAAVKRVRLDPWSSLGLGFIFVVFTPLLAFLLMLIVLGLWIGLSLMALYCVALLAGFLIACFFVAERGAHLFKQDISSKGRRLISVVIAIFVLGLVQTIPLLGGLLLFLLLLIGLGAGLLQLRYVYRTPAAGA